MTIDDAAIVFSGCTGRVRRGETIPERYGKHSTISSRVYRWLQAGIWQRIWESLMQQVDVAGNIDWEVHFVDVQLSAPTNTQVGQRGGARNTSFRTWCWWF